MCLYCCILSLLLTILVYIYDTISAISYNIYSNVSTLSIAVLFYRSMQCRTPENPGIPFDL